MKVHQIQVGQMQNFTYVVEDENTNEAIIIDPSWDLDKIEDTVNRNNLTIKYIINTHHHFDHTLGNEGMKKITNAPIIQHKNSELYHDISVGDGDVVKFGESELKVIHTPGHSKDSICLIGDGKIFTGDTLFVGNCGRIDLPGGSAKELYHSLFDKIYDLDGNLTVYSGHNYGMSPTTTIEKEKKTNVILQKRTENEFLQMMGQ
ncbi:MAG: MBL fold metallo-hydrolase [Nitrosopumilaceae archaeon]|nr:MBL fold metallo-hydrolase [Nitrosopumilaceae archaeon]NIU00505.1 MBL fold metallo-hydrolase [Nitrosopumilaceae archaeon]NIU86888.1 MBL fold metallo-hydrolase [Nitrosopumilaceae archaeon]NIV65568.1 MBL fold metallo-hydrolase [Nitrosopumilaceae archaeon]NIX61107.1 MBL fold metallo-hydrolase [Nitrosopumilaceae archaeon]